MKRSVAELLLDAGNALLEKPRRIERVPALTDAELARLKLAIDFRRRPLAVIVRAVLEDWDNLRIVKEVY